MKRFAICSILSSLICFPGLSQGETENIFLITMDGFRWEEMFRGASDLLMNDPDYTPDTDSLTMHNLFGGSTLEERREKLMPWMWTTLAKQGQLYGNRDKGNIVRCTNIRFFSYPGYNEILTGFSDPYIDSNAKKYNENITVLEWLNYQPSYRGSVAAFCSWDVFPYIINDQRSGIPVNAGFRKAKAPLSDKEVFLNELQDEIPSPWASVRLDAFTHHYMMEYIKKHRPNVVYISYGETDDFAHDGEYDHYLKSAHQTDKWLRSLWEYLQEDPHYSGKTTLLITTDHGRGTNPKEEWKSHGNTYKGSEYIWMGVIGPDTPSLGEVTRKERIFQNQFAATGAKFLGLTYYNENNEVGEVIKSMFRSIED